MGKAPQAFSMQAGGGGGRAPRNGSTALSPLSFGCPCMDPLMSVSDFPARLREGFLLPLLDHLQLSNTALQPSQVSVTETGTADIQGVSQVSVQTFHEKDLPGEVGEALRCPCPTPRSLSHVPARMSSAAAKDAGRKRPNPGEGAKLWGGLTSSTSEQTIMRVDFKPEKGQEE